MINLIEFTKGKAKYRIVEADITEERAKELEPEVKQFNETSTTHIRGIMSDFLETK